MYNNEFCCNNSMYDQPMQPAMNNDGCCEERGCVVGPVYERPVERCVQRNFVHEVVHVCPVNTRIINNHIYRHTYRPEYTCCEENVVSNVGETGCCNQ